MHQPHAHSRANFGWTVVCAIAAIGLAGCLSGCESLRENSSEVATRPANNTQAKAKVANSSRMPAPKPIVQRIEQEPTLDFPPIASAERTAGSSLIVSGDSADVPPFENNALHALPNPAFAEPKPWLSHKPPSSNEVGIVSKRTESFEQALVEAGGAVESSGEILQASRLPSDVRSPPKFLPQSYAASPITGPQPVRRPVATVFEPRVGEWYGPPNNGPIADRPTDDGALPTPVVLTPSKPAIHPTDVTQQSPVKNHATTSIDREASLRARLHATSDEQASSPVLRPSANRFEELPEGSLARIDAPQSTGRLASKIEWMSGETTASDLSTFNVRQITTTPTLMPPESVIRLTAALKNPAPVTTEDSELVTLHVDDVEVRKVFEMLSRDGVTGILVSPNVKGKITANLERIGRRAALDAIVKMSNLVAHEEGGIVFIYTPVEFREINQSRNKIGTRVYHLNYIRAKDIQDIITPFLSKELGRISMTPESEVGIASDTDKAGGNSLAGGDMLVVQDYEAVLKMIDTIIPQLDVQPIQVVIEAVIIEAILNEDLNLGVNFGVLDGAQKSLLVAGSGAAINSAAGFIPSSVLTANGKVSDGFAGTEGGVKFGFVDHDITGFMQALEQVAEARVLARRACWCSTSSGPN
ncbi:MAG: hypothetical protein O3A00_20980 [Planctomycetota bacterium]|nr:hypothetical protein [Planctomycetota bacterium]